VSRRPRQVVVLAGGLATRLGERAAAVPKYLLPVADRPFAHWQLERIAASRFASVLLCIGHLGEAIRTALGDGRRWGLRLTYVADGPEPLGTGGALRAALPRLEPTFVVTYGDSYLPFDYRGPLEDLNAHPEAQGTMAVYPNAGRFDRSNTQVIGDRVAAYDKTSQGDERPELDCIDYGATALRRSAIEQLPPGPSELSTLQADLAAAGQLRAFAVAERFYEIGSETGLAELDALLRTSPSDLGIGDRTP